MLASDSFLPSAFTDHDPNMPPSAVISPLSLNRMASSCYFDNRSTTSTNGNSLYSHQSSGAVRYPPQTQSFLSPNLPPYGMNGINGISETISSDQGPKAVSPTHFELFNGHNPSAFASTARVAPNGMPHPRSVSADAASAPASAQIIRRLAQQNARIREAWEAERKYMEANRERVEEVYKEERMIMEDERLAWEAEKNNMTEQIRRLKEQVAVVDNDKIRLQGALQRAELEKAGKVAGVTVALPGTGTRGGADGSTELSFSGFSPSNGIGERRPTNGSASASVSPAQIRPHFISPGSSRISPYRQLESSPFIPLNPNMQPTTADPVDFLGSPRDEEPVPIVDIQIINPKLEGVPLKAPAIQKSTFIDSGMTPPENSKCSSRAVSPPTESGKSRRSPTQEHTLEVLAAPEPARLVMHAGHTPSHSLSVLGTAPGTEVATVADGSGGSTPTLAPTDMSSNPATLYDVRARGDSSDLLEDAHGGIDEPLPTLEAADDVGLKGPLMVRNIPAHDEIFFKRLSEKLEDVSSGADAVPTCMKVPTPELVEEPLAAKENLYAAKMDADAASDKGSISDRASSADRDDMSESQRKLEEIDVPLKLKQSTNFGAPLGAMF
ncbi:hypothetical protein CORC01_08828 [Colletotrichum orchidophilum]|uniref:Uncharacterized protein n=1 Tax=Colletotrichum orchidophilum TaxID=1209926 RepID=A0A1G4B356_9PEZI|nr:uncharacterized protein CORC01_08828 [Colletotrichum orchidophilum]OHE95831.1 hypothetical protein CORC01_08828 [Colletotrichum orchidophilum]